MNKGEKTCILAIRLAFCIVASIITTLIVWLADVTELPRSPHTFTSIHNLSLIATTIIVVGAIAVSSTPLKPNIQSKSQTPPFRIWLRFSLALTLLFQTALVSALGGVIVPNPIDTDVLVGYATRLDETDPIMHGISYPFETFDDAFSAYPNNLALAAILRAIAHSARFMGFDANISLAVSALLLVDLAGYLTAVSVYKLSNRASFALWTYSLFCILASLSPMGLMPYSDAFSMPFTAAGICAQVHKDESGRTKTICTFLAYTFFLFGSLLKPTLLVLAIAYIISDLLSLITRHPPQTIAIMLLAPLTAGVLAFCVASPLLKGSFQGTIEPTRSVSWQHYLNMGLNPEGKGDFVFADHAASMEYATREERAAANLESAQARFNSLIDSRRLLTFYSEKLMLTFNDGTFSFPGNLRSESEATNDPIVENIRKLFIFQEGNAPPMREAEQVAWLMVLILLPFSALGKPFPHTESKRHLGFLHLAFLGLVLFQLLFETRTRLLFPFLPLILPLAATGLGSIVGYFEKASRKEKGKMPARSRKSTGAHRA